MEAIGAHDVRTMGLIVSHPDFLVAKSHYPVVPHVDSASAKKCTIFLWGMDPTAHSLPFMGFIPLILEHPSI